MNFDNPSLTIEKSQLAEGSICWQSPSNLAIVKYWGKHGRQLPNNPSISFTLQEAHTTTEVIYTPKEVSGMKHKIDISFYFNNEQNTAFQTRVERFLSGLTPIFPFLYQFSFKIYSANSFPHSSGIASSASAMSALALCICSMEKRFFSTLSKEEVFLMKASYCARLGSGSACRSVYPHLAVWGRTEQIESSSDYYAIPFGEAVHEIFRTFHDDILIVSSKKKEVSSTAGHALMDESFYAQSRYRQANYNIDKLVSILRSGEIEAFGEILEGEALTLHALMMTSARPYLLMTPPSLSIIRRIWNFRAETKLPIFFSLDAGPNIHLLYPGTISDKVEPFIDSELKQFCEDSRILRDGVGEGPVKCD